MTSYRDNFQSQSPAFVSGSHPQFVNMPTAPPPYSSGPPVQTYPQANVSSSYPTVPVPVSHSLVGSSTTNPSSIPNPNFVGSSASYLPTNSSMIQRPPAYDIPGGNFPTTQNVPKTDCVSKVELNIRCNDLLDMDVFSKSDPMVVVQLENRGHWIEKGRTEMILNCLNPEFSKKIQLDYYFEETQKLRFSVYDIDNTTPSLEDDDFLGLADCTLGQIVSSSPLTLPLMGRSSHGRMGKGTITIHAEEIDTGNKDMLLLTFRAERLDNLRWFSKSNPFLEFHVIDAYGKLKMVHRTEPVPSNLFPTWKGFEVRRQAFGGENVEYNILIKCYDSRSSGNHELIGECQITLGQMLEAQNKSISLPCINISKRQRKGRSYVDSGVIILHHCQVIKTFSFLDYILSGTQIHFTVAVDFTASNGDPRDSKSLHYMHPTFPNQYMRAIWAVGGVVQDYDTDKLFPALGFGAKIPPRYEVSHEFALNFNASNPYCDGVQGLLDAYHRCLTQVQLYGPTNFAPVINHVAQFAMQAHEYTTAEEYFILLILTDGVVTDIQHTLHAVVKASYLPLSIIIVGVGKADFQQMEFLDADGTLLRTPSGNVAKRDIVQFVPFYKFEHGDPALLAKEVLAELPQQLTEYYRWRNIPPKSQSQPLLNS